jgi:hypothetical protein
MQISEQQLTKKQALALTGGDHKALARLLGIDPDTPKRWPDKGPIPKYWSTILVNLLFREKFDLPPLPNYEVIK